MRSLANNWHSSERGLSLIKSNESRHLRYLRGRNIRQLDRVSTRADWRELRWSVHHVDASPSKSIRVVITTAVNVRRCDNLYSADWRVRNHCRYRFRNSLYGKHGVITVRYSANNNVRFWMTGAWPPAECFVLRSKNLLELLMINL